MRPKYSTRKLRRVTRYLLDQKKAGREIPQGTFLILYDAQVATRGGQ